jgi:epoxyqueuosine reductase
LTPEKAREEIESMARQLGAVLFGVANLRDVPVTSGEVSQTSHETEAPSGRIPGRSRNASSTQVQIAGTSGEVSLEGLPTGICFGYRLSDVVLEGIVDHPTRTYQYHYRQVNLLLDHIGLRITSYLQKAGRRAFPVPSSQVVDWGSYRGHISHKAIGRLAGLGWIGKNNLLINPRHGARVRYASVLTDLVLPYDTSVDEECGECRKCVAACPGDAIGAERASFSLERCIGTIDTIRKKADIGSRICGICVRACTGKA